MTLTERPVNYGPLQTLVAAELTVVKAAATTWAGSISTLIALGGVFGLTVADKTLGPLVSTGVSGRLVVVVVLLVYGIGVIVAQLAAQGRLRSGEVGRDPDEVLFRDTVAAIKATRWYLRISRWCVGISALASWLVLLYSVTTLGVTPRPAFLIFTPNKPVRCSTLLTRNASGTLLLNTVPLPTGSTVQAVSSCPAVPGE
ncbi:hypothetical protein [Deinococcus sonorensis]|uniref:RDD domain-containing protein n=2 Tax=Deinococcus sonorensis TaxID=309891 RepID=A0AAU7UG36_9DEIO